MASELKSDVSSHSTNPAYLTYIMYYIILYCVCQVFFLIGVWFLCGVETKAKNKEPLQALAYPSYLLKKDIEVIKSFLVVRTLICFQRASSLFLELSNNAQQTITSDGEWQTRTVSSLFFKQISYAIIASIPHMSGLGFTANHTSRLSWPVIFITPCFILATALMTFLPLRLTIT